MTRGDALSDRTPVPDRSEGSSASAGRLDVVDGLRGIAILMVIFRHTFFDTFASPGYHLFFFGDDGIPIFPFTHLSNTWMGVNLFFIDSGFVLFLPYARGRRAFITFADVRAFYARRAWRLLPLYYVMLGVCWIQDTVSLHHMKSPWVEIPAYVTFTFPFSSHYWRPSLNGALWSIGIEVGFSALFPLFAWLALRVGTGRFAAAAAAIALGTRYVAYACHVGTQSTPTLNTLADSVLGRLDNFALGMVAATLFVRGWRTIGSQVAMVAALMLYTASAWLWDDYLVMGRSGLSAPLLGYEISNVAFFLLLMAALQSKGLLRRLLVFGPLRGAGVICYSLYLVHVPVLWSFGGAPRGMAIPAFWAVTGCLSYLTYTVVEKRGIERGRRG